MIWRLSATSNPTATTGISTKYGCVLSFVSGLLFMCTPHPQKHSGAGYVSNAWLRGKLSTAAAGSGRVTPRAGSSEKRTSGAVPRFCGITQRVPIAIVAGLTCEYFGFGVFDFFGVSFCRGNDLSDILCWHFSFRDL